MRVNIYAEEITERVEVISKEIDGHVFTGLRLYLYLPVTLPDGTNQAGPFMHRDGDDDSAAITFWGKRDLRDVLKIMQEKLNAYYDAPPALSGRQEDAERCPDCGAERCKPGCPSRLP